MPILISAMQVLLVAGDSGTIRIGYQGIHTATYIAGISGVAVAGDPVVTDSNGQLAVGMASSKRFKDEIKPMGDASEAILALKPVTFRYKGDLDPSRLYNESISDIAKMPALAKVCSL
jgi:endosialidase-like protein